MKVVRNLFISFTKKNIINALIWLIFDKFIFIAFLPIFPNIKSLKFILNPQTSNINRGFKLYKSYVIFKLFYKGNFNIHFN